MSVFHVGADQLGALHACARAAAAGMEPERRRSLTDGILAFLTDYSQHNTDVFRAKYAHNPEALRARPVRRGEIAAASLAHRATPETCTADALNLGGGLAYQIAEQGVPEGLVAHVRDRETALRSLIDSWIGSRAAPAAAPPAPSAPAVPARRAPMPSVATAPKPTPDPMGHAIRQTLRLGGVTPPDEDPSLDETIGRLRAGLKAQTGRAWSVKRGRGTAYSWIDVEPPRARRVCGRFGEPADADDAQTFAFAARMRPHLADREKIVQSYLEDKRAHPGPVTGGACLADAEELGRIFRSGSPETHFSIPPGRGCWAQHVALAEGREPARDCERDWD